MRDKRQLRAITFYRPRVRPYRYFRRRFLHAGRRAIPRDNRRNDELRPFVEFNEAPACRREI